MLDAIRYLVAGEGSWRAMPADFPAWGRVHAFFRRWREHGLIAAWGRFYACFEFHERLHGTDREREGREAESTAGIIDAQSVRAAATVPASSRGYAGGKKVPGRKRHIVTDCLGLLLVVAVTAGGRSDSTVPSIGHPLQTPRDGDWQGSTAGVRACRRLATWWGMGRAASRSRSRCGRSRRGSRRVHTDDCASVQLAPLLPGCLPC
ncbi:transposase [Streptomyces sp. ISL-10]|uniref:transposase n=1 Tax=Streptomyces sp. ISL-10 TaxID=2819172 RepID=UPI0020359ED4|nr:transposase [Streptomyces sp. ISL-10]